jgi:hypothetical protein
MMNAELMRRGKKLNETRRMLMCTCAPRPFFVENKEEMEEEEEIAEEEMEEEEVEESRSALEIIILTLFPLAIRPD